MLSLLLLAPPIGVVIGYLATALFIANMSWHWVYYAQAFVAIVPTTFLICFIRSKYFDIESAVERKFDETHPDLSMGYELN